jgi:hypothetical protein
MTETEWLGCGDPVRMLEYLLGKASERKFRLLACGCIRPNLPGRYEFGCETAVETAEMMCDGKGTEELYATAVSAIEQGNVEASKAWSYLVHAASAALRVEGALAAAFALEDMNTFNLELHSRTDHSGVVTIMRDIFGNPFRPVTLDPTWLTSTVIAVAQQMYDSRDFSAMPILADPLERKRIKQRSL